MSKNEKLAKKVDFTNFLDPNWYLAVKRVSKFVIPEFRDTLLVPKITKCGDLLYYAMLFFTKMTDLLCQIVGLELRAKRQ